MSRTTRRSFAKGVAAALITGVPAATPAIAAETTALAEAMVAVVKAQSGQHLTSADLERVRADFKDYVPALERLRAVKLSNSDEPDVTFAALAKRWR